MLIVRFGLISPHVAYPTVAWKEGCTDTDTRSTRLMIAASNHVRDQLKSQSSSVKTRSELLAAHDARIPLSPGKPDHGCPFAIAVRDYWIRHSGGSHSVRTTRSRHQRQPCDYPGGARSSQWREFTECRSHQTRWDDSSVRNNVKKRRLMYSRRFSRLQCLCNSSWSGAGSEDHC